jgi:hypothetical protein
MFGDRRETVRRVLEVGVNAGSSLRMWEEYFPAAEVIGLDIRTDVLFTAGRIRCYQADQGVRQSLQAAVAAAGGGLFDLIIDDGSHLDDHQIVTAETLLPLLAPGGHLVLGDLRHLGLLPALHASVGLYKAAQHGGTVVDVDFFASLLSLKDGALANTDITRENAVITPTNAGQRLWEQLGLTADPKQWYDVALTLTGAADAAGVVGLRCTYVDGT